MPPSEAPLEPGQAEKPLFDEPTPPERRAEQAVHELDEVKPVAADDPFAGAGEGPFPEQASRGAGDFESRGEQVSKPIRLVIDTQLGTPMASSAAPKTVFAGTAGKQPEKQKPAQKGPSKASGSKDDGTKDIEILDSKGPEGTWEVLTHALSILNRGNIFVNSLLMRSISERTGVVHNEWIPRIEADPCQPHISPGFVCDALHIIRLTQSLLAVLQNGCHSADLSYTTPCFVHIYCSKNPTMGMHAAIAIPRGGPGPGQDDRHRPPQHGHLRTRGAQKSGIRKYVLRACQ